MLWMLMAVFQDEEIWKAGAQIRAQLEARTPMSYRLVDGDEGDEYGTMRWRPYLKITPEPWIEIFLQPQLSLGFWGDTATAPEQDEFDFHQLSVAFNNIDDSGFSLKVGRMELQYGDQRMISPLDWSHIGRAWDGIKLGYKGDGWWIDGFATDINEGVAAGHDRQFHGLYAGVDIAEGHKIEPYLLYRRFGHDNFASESGTRVGDQDFWWLGALYKGKEEAWDYSAEAVYQGGDVASDDVSAWGIALTAGHTFDEDWKPRAGIEYTYATGDESPADGDVDRFVPPFTFGHSYQGYADLFTWSNGHDLVAHFSAKPHAEWTVTLAIHNLWLDERRDAWFNAGGAVIRRDATGASASYVGTEIDVAARYIPDEHINLWFGGAFFAAGEFVDDTGFDDDQLWGFVQLTITF